MPLKDTSINYGATTNPKRSATIGEVEALIAQSQADVEADLSLAIANTNEVSGQLAGAGRKLSNISIDVKEDFGAKGNGIENDTTVIQSAINSLGNNGGTIYFPAGIYMVDTIDAIGGIRNNGGLLIQNPINILLHKNAVIQARLASATQGNTIFNIRNTNNVTIDGGTIIGDRLLQPGGASTQSMNGILIANSQDITIKNCIIKHVWGDGLAVWHDTIASKNIQIENVTVQNSRRNNFTVGAVDGLTIKKCFFIDANGALPMAGIDIEPDGLQGMAQNVLIDGCTFRGNITADIIFGGGNSCRNITVTNSNLTNSINIPPSLGQKVDNVVISNNIIELPDGSINSGVALLRVNNCVISKNVIFGKTMTGNGINIKDSVTKLVVADNVIYKVKNGVYVASNIPGISTIKVINNIVEDVERHLYILSSSSYFDIKGNTFTKATTGSQITLVNSAIEGNKFNNTSYATITVFLINCVVSKNQFENCGVLDKTKAMLDLYQAENCLIDGNMFQSDTITQPPIYENAIPTLPSVISNNFARYRTSNLGVIKTGTILLNNYTASQTRTYFATAMPTTGTYTQGDIVTNTSPTTANPVGYWLRLTSGSGHVLDTDWKAK